jgi:hypothetical protein
MFGCKPRTTITAMYSNILKEMEGMTENQGARLYNNEVINCYHSAIETAILCKIETLDGIKFRNAIHVNRLKLWRGRERFSDSEVKLNSATPRALVYETARLAPIGRRIAVKYYKSEERLYPG